MCDCIVQADKALAEHGIRLKTTIVFPIKCVGGVVITAETDFIGKKPRGEHAPFVRPKFCMFCGEKVTAFDEVPRKPDVPPHTELLDGIGLEKTT